VRYRGPLLDYGNVMILEPARGYLMVIAGLGTVYGATGDVLDAGGPIGLMPEAPAGRAQSGGAERSETLYVELRQDGETLDPLEWFVQSGQ
jgi:septal ring factor EnvC (AmiA/AmiB activator)